MNDSTVTNGYSRLTAFLKTLAEEGRAVVSAEPLDDATADASEVLRQLDGYARAELALEAPAFCEATALWAGRLLYGLCQFTVCRDVDEEEIKTFCALAAPQPRTPDTDWSADLVLRHLPRLFQLARHLSNADPLVQHMKRIATDWPLSSVGIPDLESLRLDSFVEHPALRRLYADRILAGADSSRLGDDRVDNLLRADLGAHHELAPSLASKLFQTTHDTH